MAQKIQRFEMRLSPEQDKELLEYMEIFIAQSERFGGTRSGVLKSMANYFMEKHPNGLIDTLNDMTDDVVRTKETETPETSPVDEPATDENDDSDKKVKVSPVVGKTQTDKPAEAKSQEVSAVDEKQKTDPVEKETVATTDTELKAQVNEPAVKVQVANPAITKADETHELSLSDTQSERDDELSVIQNAKKKNFDLFANSTFQTK